MNANGSRFHENGMCCPAIHLYDLIAAIRDFTGAYVIVLWSLSTVQEACKGICQSFSGSCEKLKSTQGISNMGLERLC